MIVPAPILGLHRGQAAKKQPISTSFDLINTRPYDTTSERVRIGQRPGQVKAYTTQVSGASHPILQLTAITTTYIEPS